MPVPLQSTQNSPGEWFEHFGKKLLYGGKNLCFKSFMISQSLCKCENLVTEIKYFEKLAHTNGDELILE